MGEFVNRKEILDILSEYNFNFDEYVVISGAALVLLGVKEETKDIDISVTEDYYEYLEKNYECKLEKYDDKNDVNIYYIDDVINFSTNYYSDSEDDFVIINGVKVQSIPAISKLKETLNREKDIKDLKLIDEFLNNTK